MRGTDAVNDNRPALEPLHGVFRTVFPFGDRTGGQAGAAVVGDAVWLGTVTENRLIVICVICYPRCRLLIRQSGPDQFIEQINRLPCPVIVQADKDKGLRKPAPVHALTDAVEVPDFLIRNLTQFETLKNIAAAPYRDSQILVFIPSLIAFFQALGLFQECRTKPVRVVQVQIGAVMPNPVRSLELTVPVDPMVPGAGRVKRLQVPERTAAAHGRLENVFDLRAPGKLVRFLKMRNADIAKIGLKALQLCRIVGTAEEDLLASRCINQLRRGLFGRPVIADTQGLNRPEILIIDRIAQGAADLPQHEGMHIRVVHQQADHRHGSPA